MNKVDCAVACFSEGFSCSQAVFATYAKDMGMDYEMALKVSQAFGGGMGGMKGECGAVTGAYMVISLFYGRTKAEDAKARLKTFEMVQRFNKCFKEVHRTSVCKELLEGCEGNSHDLCAQYVKDACIILETLLNEELKEK
ncbi:MAG: C-GCAxxG-C-C family protein [Cellulosilyticaceae bacterium]